MALVRSDVLSTFNQGRELIATSGSGDVEVVELILGKGLYSVAGD